MNLLRPILFTVMCAAVLLLSACSNNPESIATEKYMAYLKQADSYAMFGGVLKQGRYSLHDATPHLTVTQAILRAGGLCAHKDHIVLRRGSGKFAQRLLINLDAIMRKGDVDEANPVLKAGDVIFVYKIMQFSKL